MIHARKPELKSEPTWNNSSVKSFPEIGVKSQRWPAVFPGPLHEGRALGSKWWGPGFEAKMSCGGKATCRLWHNGQVKTCRACNKEGYIARNCPSTTEPRRNSSNPWAFRQHEKENESRSKEDENESRNEQDHSLPVRQEQEAEDKKTKENSEKKHSKRETRKEKKNLHWRRNGGKAKRAQSIGWMASPRKKLTPQINVTTRRIPGWRPV